jgi:protein-tyrosine kinase
MPELKEAYDAVIIDTPPLSIGADASAVAARVDGVILIVDLSKATTKGLRNALRQLESAKAKILGIVVNRDPHHAAESYSYYGYAREANGDRRALARNLLDRARETFSR